MPFSNGSVYINGTEHKFVNNGINLTLAPGKYNVEIYNGTTLYKTLNVSLSAGKYLPLNVAKKYNVTFTEKGPLSKLVSPSVTWYVNLSNGQSFKSTNSTIAFIEANGTYKFTVCANLNYTSNIESGAFHVNGNNATKSIAFSKPSSIGIIALITLTGIVAVAAGSAAFVILRKKK